MILINIKLSQASNDAKRSFFKLTTAGKNDDLISQLNFGIPIAKLNLISISPSLWHLAQLSFEAT